MYANGFGLDSGDIVMRIKHSFVYNNNICRMCCSNISFGNGNVQYYNVLVWLMEVFVTGILYTFGNDNNKCRMCFSSIGIGKGDVILVLYEY